MLQCKCGGDAFDVYKYDLNGPSLSKCFVPTVIDVVFFFQAEDGIRDYKVTGVQTCALPICTAYRGPWQFETLAREVLLDIAARDMGMDPIELRRRNLLRRDELPFANPSGKIGRASCRERV